MNLRAHITLILSHLHPTEIVKNHSHDGMEFKKQNEKEKINHPHLPFKRDKHKLARTNNTLAK
jgi:hypothetical protein